jgi:hypothetical protein
MFFYDTNCENGPTKKPLAGKAANVFLFCVEKGSNKITILNSIAPQEKYSLCVHKTTVLYAQKCQVELFYIKVKTQLHL